MQIVELGVWNTYDNIINHAPFVYSIQPGTHELESDLPQFLLDLIPPNNDRVFVNGFQESLFLQYATVDTLPECIALERSFYWDDANQTLYVHLIHESPYDSDTYSYEALIGFSDSDLIYIDDLEYLPQLSSVPSLRQQEDLQNYRGPSLVNGSIVLDNAGGELDYFITRNLYGNNIFVSYIDNEDLIDDGKGNLSGNRSDINRLLSLIIDDYDKGMGNIRISVLDVRTENNKKVPDNFITITDFPDVDEQYLDQPIKVIYGQIREILAIPLNTNSSSNLVEFTVAETMTNFGTIQVEIDEVWTNIEPVISDLGNGRFSLLRSEIEDTPGRIRNVRLLNCIGIVNNNAGDVIKDLHERFLGLMFVNAFYNVEEFTEESSSLSPISLVIDEEIELSNLINNIQNGCNIGFRYEVNALGRRTIRIDDETRSISGFIDQENIQNIYDLNVNSNRDLVFSNTLVRYNKSDISGRFFSVRNDDYRDMVIRESKKDERLPIETFLVTESDANQRAAIDALRFSQIPEIVGLTISTPNKDDRLLYFNIRIFDIFAVPLTYDENIDFESFTFSGSRDFYGIKFIKVLSIFPQISENQIQITGKILTDDDLDRVFDFSGKEEEFIYNFTSNIESQSIYNFTDED